jgi:hypothetical protein
MVKWSATELQKKLISARLSEHSPQQTSPYSGAFSLDKCIILESKVSNLLLTDFSNSSSTPIKKEMIIAGPGWEGRLF